MNTASSVSPTRRLSHSSSRRRVLLATAGAAIVGAAFCVASVQAQNTVYNFTNFNGDGNYKNAANWDLLTIPDLTTTNTAQINDGVAVTYTPGGDLVIKNGGILEVSNGSYTQAGGNNYLQLNGNGTVLVDGGTFNQGTASSSPFNVTGTGNAFTVTAGNVFINTSFQLNTGLAFSQSGGSVTVTGAETDFNDATNTLSGGMLTTTLITGVNGPAPTRFDISGGTLNLTGAGSNGIYGGGTTRFINFTPGSTGQITFTSGQETMAEVKGFINAGVIEYNSGGTGTLANFNIAQNGTTITLSLVGAVPEPSTIAATLLGAVGLGSVILRRRRA